MSEANGVKPGNQTSEYKIEWLTTLIALSTVIIPVVMEALDKGSWIYVLLSCVLAVAVKLGSMGYSKSRAIVKASAANPPPPPG
jgi:hypothetical protein